MIEYLLDFTKISRRPHGDISETSWRYLRHPAKIYFFSTSICTPYYIYIRLRTQTKIKIKTKMKTKMKTKTKTQTNTSIHDPIHTTQTYNDQMNYTRSSPVSNQSSLVIPLKRHRKTSRKQSKNLHSREKYELPSHTLS